MMINQLRNDYKQIYQQKVTLQTTLDRQREQNMNKIKQLHETIKAKTEENRLIAEQNKANQDQVEQDLNLNISRIKNKRRVDYNFEREDMNDSILMLSIAEYNKSELEDKLQFFQKQFNQVLY